MTNFEYYKDQILTLAIKDSRLGMDAKNKSLCSCNKLYCIDCAFSNINNGCDGLSCDSRRTLWLYTEYVEKPTLTKQERAFLEICKPECYIARDDKTDELYLFKSKPIKNNDYWSCSVGSCVNVSTMITKSVLIFDGIDRPFSFIKWEDKKPWKVEDLLKLEVK